MFADKGQVLGDRGCMVGTKFGRKAQRDIDWENERTTDGGNASGDVSAMCGSAVPRIPSSMGGWDPNKRVGAIIGCFGGGVESNLQDVAHGLEGGKKIAAGVDDNHAAHSKLEKETFVEGGGRPRCRSGNAMQNKVGIGVGRVSGGPIQRAGRSVGVVKKDRDGIVTGAVIVIQGGENGIHGGVGEAQGGSERKTGT